MKPHFSVRLTTLLASPSGTLRSCWDKLIKASDEVVDAVTIQKGAEVTVKVIKKVKETLCKEPLSKAELGQEEWAEVKKATTNLQNAKRAEQAVGTCLVESLEAAITDTITAIMSLLSAHRRAILPEKKGLLDQTGEEGSNSLKALAVLATVLKYLKGSTTFELAEMFESLSKIRTIGVDNAEGHHLNAMAPDIKTVKDKVQQLCEGELHGRGDLTCNKSTITYRGEHKPTFTSNESNYHVMLFNDAKQAHIAL